MADISEMQTAVSTQGGTVGPDDASRLVAALLQAHDSEALAMAPDTTMYPASKIGRTTKTGDMLGVYLSESDRVFVKSPDNNKYRAGFDPNKSEGKQLDTQTVLDYYNIAKHELQHARSHPAKQTKQGYGDNWGVIQQAKQRGVSPAQISAAVSAMQKTAAMPSVVNATDPEVVMEEFLAYAVPNRDMTQRIGVNTPAIAEQSAAISQLTAAHPWLEALIQDWQRPELQTKKPR